MTLIAGIFNRKGHALDNSVCRELVQCVSRHPGDTLETIRKPNAFFAKLDIGAFGSKGLVETEDAISLLTGEPLLERSSTHTGQYHPRQRMGQRDHFIPPADLMRMNHGYVDRHADLSLLHDDLANGNRDRLRDTNGAFTLAHYQPQSSSLTLIADKCALRPLYFWISDEVVVFASALRVLEACALVPKKMDLRAVTELVALGSNLGRRTPYVSILRVTAGQIIEITRDDVNHATYWAWDQIGTSAETEPERLQAVHAAFDRAIKRRMRADHSTSAFLSGGLDSRLAVASLRQNRIEVHTVNFALTGTQDQFLGDEFAKRVGSLHHSIPREAGDSVPDYSSLMANVLARTDRDCERPRIVWSGEGGSTTLGFVRFTQSNVELMRMRNFDAVVNWFVREEATQVPVKLFRSRLLDNAMDMVREGVREELNKFNADDPAWNLYLFLTLNDQAHKLTRHFENIDLHRLEFQLPFFDATFLQAVLATRIDWLLAHRFYVNLLPYFGEAAATTPWQSYPGHQACPLPIPAELTYQWNEEYQAGEHAAKRKRMVERASHLLRGVDFPSRILDKRKLRLAAWLHATGWRDYQYAIEAAETYSRYSAICRGEFSLSLS